ncbi:malate dehydrogenase (oxaloacetate-decarboxylating) [Anaerocolumna jejuensis DSM 15929]|uniref:Malate dehydrogenase (Oxaloacetate-decarboxylating) n=1 Tax=Anaerocolumna jejuensis DSM 15929 TaxID=1121322 RepID=A0A1M6P3K9_9FIRM|nr:malic enzyme-like NAD(P)-binding protein [Anaerocolumna jejuensis]SHK02472.1 malate dehydrogenase (oxaloacetate-decarboxylating) [Anaerocolumna jejuensis DSM 15929]
MNYFEEALKSHAKTKGKISVESKVKLENRDDLSIAYTPGVAEPCREIHKDISKVYEYTSKGNMVAVVSDGTAVLGLGNIGAAAAIPVMEGKAVLFKKFGNIDAIPICLDTTDKEEIIRTVKLLAPCFGGINLEDISSPKCFEIEKRLEEEMDIPVFHDDQHGTAIVVTAALINALKVVDKKLDEIKLVLNGPGAAGTAIIKMLLAAGVKNISVCDEFGILYQGRPEGMVEHKRELAVLTNKEQKKGTLSDAVKGADVFIGVSIGGALTKEMVKSMNQDAIVFAMANPNPEITYEDALEAGVRVMGTGRSDYPNQINNVLAFPGVFKGALQARARNITYDMKLAAAVAIAELVSEKELKPEYIIPSVFDERVVEHVAKKVAEAASYSCKGRFLFG